jgi:hypothetical protein
MNNNNLQVNQIKTVVKELRVQKHEKMEVAKDASELEETMRCFSMENTEAVPDAKAD